MSELSSATSQARRRRRRTAADRARYLAAFAQRGLRSNEFCAEAGIPRSSFILWQQQARNARPNGAVPTRLAPPGFAQVEVVPARAVAGITMVIRSGQDVVAEFAGLDGTAAVTLLSTTLKHRRR